MGEFEAIQLLIIAGIGLAAGVLGGMLGVGGSLIMIPALVFLYGQGHGSGDGGAFGPRDFFDQHLYQAAAMAVNVAVAAGATWRHYQARAIQPAVLRCMMPAAIVLILVGVAVSNLPIFRDGPGPTWLGRVLAVFLVYVIAVNIRKLIKKPALSDNPAGDSDERPAPTAGRSGLVGSMMGFAAGLMGIGGGAIAVPMQQVILRQKLRHCIANSAAVMCVSAGIGAAYKMVSLPGEAIGPALTVAALLGPTALIGGFIGGRLTHTVPVAGVRMVWIALLVAAAWKMAAL